MRIISAIVLAVLIVGGCADGQQKAPNFKAKTQDGAAIELAQLKGKVVVLNFWATWCGPCRREIPDFGEVYKAYKSKGVEIVGVALDEQGWSVVKPFVDKNKIPYPIVLPDEHLSSDYGEISAIPTTFIIDKNGNVVGKRVGMMEKSDLEKAIKSAL
jgi:peroxiredoxin